MLFLLTLVDAVTRGFAWALLALIILVPVLVWVILIMVVSLVLIALAYEVADYYAERKE
jgi:hypothetical protein